MNNSINTPQAENKSKYHLILSIGMILPAAFLFCVTADLPHVFFITLFILVASALKQKAIKYTDRSVIYGLVTAMVLAVLLDLVFKIPENRFGYISSFFYPGVTCPFLLYMAAIVTFYRSGAHPLGISACFSLTTILLGGDIFNFNISLESQTLRLGFMQPFIEHIYIFYSATILIEIIFLLLAFNSIRTYTKNSLSRKHLWKKYLVKYLALLMIPLISITALYLYKSYEHQWRRLENMMLKFGMNWQRKSDRILFSKDIDLNRTISPEVEKNNDQIVLRVISKTPPGYLRGRAYTTYNEGRWTGRNKTESAKTLKMKQHTGILAFTTFYYDDLKDYSNSKYIFFAGKFFSDVLFLPGNCRQIDTVADKLKVTLDGNISVEEWEKDGGYSAYQQQNSQASAFPTPLAPGKEYLQVPKKLDKDLQKLLSQILLSENKTRKMSSEDLGVIMEITSWFNKNFEYSLEADVTKSRKDPVIYFMQKLKKGHCELFAASTVMLLRKYGIPARYVTGFICEEAHPGKKYYVSRLGHAHAWVEAYLRDQQKWVLVEPTPPTGIPNFSHEWGLTETWIDWIKEIAQKTLADVRRGYFAQAIISVFSGLFYFFRDLVWHPLRGTGILLLILAVFLYRRHRKLLKLKQSAKREDEIPPNTQILIAQFKALEKSVAKKYEQERAPQQTLEEWAKLIGNESFIQLITDYQKLRYRKNEPEDKALKEFKTQVKIFLDNLKPA